MSPLNAGDLSHIVEIQQPTRTSDGQGGQSVSWATLDTVYGSVEALSYREAIQAAQVTDSLQTAVTIYYRSDVSVKHRLVIEGRTLAIQSVQDPDGLREMLRLICAEVSA